MDKNCMPSTILNEILVSMEDGRINLWCEGGRRVFGKICETENVSMNLI